MGRKRGADDDPTVRLSKKMSAVLRHRIHENGLGSVLRPDGFVPVDALLATPGFRGVRAEEVRNVVRTNEKQRFALLEEGGTLYIRANQGHTSAGIDADELLERLDDAAAAALGGGRGLAVHGTRYGAWGGIVASGGLHRMARHHIHLAEGMLGEAGVISGMRASAEVFVWVDVRRAMALGAPFFRSANGVILTPGRPSDELLPLEAFARIVDCNGREWRDGGWQKADGSAGSTESASPEPGDGHGDGDGGRRAEAQS